MAEKVQRRDVKLRRVRRGQWTATARCGDQGDQVVTGQGKSANEAIAHLDEQLADLRGRRELGVN